MTIRCFFGFHDWQGCKCRRCGKTRAEGHHWESDCELCALCGSTRDGFHEIRDNRCAKCGKTIVCCPQCGRGPAVYKPFRMDGMLVHKCIQCGYQDYGRTSPAAVSSPSSRQEQPRVLTRNQVDSTHFAKQTCLDCKGRGCPACRGKGTIPMPNWIYYRPGADQYRCKYCQADVLSPGVCPDPAPADCLCLFADHDIWRCPQCGAY
jgi:Zn ribbon nucleic-acid-binding protein